MSLGRLPAMFVSIVLSTALSSGQDAGSQPTTNSPPQNSRPAITVAVSRAPVSPARWDPPKYPQSALESKTGGDVVLTLNVDEKGRVKAVSVVSGDPDFTKPAIDAARKWKYAPDYQPGESVTVSTSVAIRFRVGDDGTPRISAVGTQVAKTNDGATAPDAVFSPEPQYSQEAMAAKYQGNCVLALTVGSDGSPSEIHVSRSVGLGLDQEAIEALQTWRFKPATKDGKPVPVPMSVQVQFHIF